VSYLAKPFEVDAVASAVERARDRAPTRRARPELLETGPIPLRGDVAQIPFARLLGRLAEREADGALLLWRSATQKVAFFEAGRPVFVQSNLVAESLGQLILQERILTAHELEGALAEKRRTGRPLGDVLVERRILSEHHLAFLLERQMEKKLFDLFAWTEGSFRYRPGARHHGPRVTLPMGPLGLVFEGATRHMTTERIEADLARERHRRARAVDPDRVRDAVLALEPSASRLVRRLDGSASVETLFQDGEVGRAEAVRLVYGVIVAGLVELADPAPPVLSSDVRDRVRARLDAEMRRFERTHRRHPASSPARSRVTPLEPDARRALDEHLRETAEQIAGRGYFELLGVPDDADEATLRRAYRAASQRLDPARLLAGYDAPDLLRRAEANHLAVVRAFQVTTDPDGRALYAAWRSDPEVHRLAVLRGRDRACEAEAALATERFVEAATGFRSAAAADPTVAAYAAAAAWADYGAGVDPDACLEAIRTASARAPDDAECMVFEARLHAAEGRADDARALYRAALAVEPSCVEARRVAGGDAPAAEPPRGVIAKVTEGARGFFGRPSPEAPKVPVKRER